MDENISTTSVYEDPTMRTSNKTRDLVASDGNVTPTVVDEEEEEDEKREEGTPVRDVQNLNLPPLDPLERNMRLPQSPPSSLQVAVSPRSKVFDVSPVKAYKGNTSTGSPTKTTSACAQPRIGSKSKLLWFLGTLLKGGVHTILFVCALAFAVAYCLQSVHDGYFVPMMERARRTDEDLKDEQTYYRRPCSVVDVSATAEQAPDLWLTSRTDENTQSTIQTFEDKEETLDTMMKHGAVLIPDVLSQDTVTELREFVVWKNEQVRGSPAEFPVSQGYQRISYGIEAAEDPRVIKALKEIYDNKPLKDLLEGLVGYNPALTEITAITASYGCPNQVWHSDVKYDGNGVQFGRTYSHSYSLFMVLQNTTAEMGATDLCPGTHYCADDISQVCDDSRIRLNELHPDNIARAGDAALLNQQVWHRGTAHEDPDGGDRILFIVSFIGRPNDPRQLSRGTYFHMKWNMWGHTWQDLADSATSMISPFNVLRCLHLWKPSGRAWGYDLITASALRIANNQLGCEPEDLTQFLEKLTELGMPEFLDGTIDLDSDEAWQIYIRESIANIFEFLLKVNLGLLAGYFTFVILGALASKSRGFMVLSNGVKRIFWSHGIVVFFAWYTMQSIDTSKWAVDISSGKTLMRPFPKVEKPGWEDHGLPSGPTTRPMRFDYLVGTRLNTPTIGLFSRWMDFHPGNKIVLDQINEFGSEIFRSYDRGLPSIFAETLVDFTIQAVEDKLGRFLYQDYRTGDWKIMSLNDTKKHIRQRLFLGRRTLLSKLQREIDFQYDYLRFGFLLREKSISRHGQVSLRKLEEKLFRTAPVRQESSLIDSIKETKRQFKPVFGPLSFSIPSISKLDVLEGTRVLGSNRKWSELPEDDFSAFRLHEEVMVNVDENNLVPATIIEVSDDGWFYDLALYGETADYHNPIWHKVHRHYLTRFVPPQAGIAVEGNYREFGEWFKGKITSVRPSGSVSILYDDGDYEREVEPYAYYVPVSHDDENTDDEETDDVPVSHDDEDTE